MRTLSLVSWSAAVVGIALLTRATGCRGPQPVLPREAAASTCADCHVEIAAEWAESAHAQAWTSKAFGEESEGRTRAECLGCHAPATLLATEGTPSVRPWRREDGVDCQACHLDDDGSLLGPHAAQRPELLQAHLVRRESIRYRSSEFCGRCHVATWGEVQAYGLSPDRQGVLPTCQECHMQPVVRKLLGREEVRQRRHGFDLTPEAGEGEDLQLSLHAQREADQVALAATLTNGLPHALPTGGEFSRSQVVLSAAGFDAGGEATQSLDHTFTAPGLEASGAFELTGSLPAETTRIEVTLTRLCAGRPTQVLLRREQPVE